MTIQRFDLQKRGRANKAQPHFYQQHQQNSKKMAKRNYSSSYVSQASEANGLIQSATSNYFC